MKTEDIIQLSVNDIQVKLKEKHDELMNLKLKTTTGQMKEPHRIKNIRKSIARLETEKSKKLRK